MGDVVKFERKDAPVCCHEGADSHNIGYTKMVLTDGTPIEAELYTYDYVTILSVIMPEFDSKHKTLHAMGIRDHGKDVIPFSRDTEGRDFSVLGIGMVIAGEEDDIDTVCEYAEYLADMGIIRWLGDMRDGAVEYLIDVEGHDLACVKITVEEDGRRICEVLPEFQPFEEGADDEI